MTRTLDGLESALAVLVLSSPPYLWFYQRLYRPTAIYNLWFYLGLRGSMSVWVRPPKWSGLSQIKIKCSSTVPRSLRYIFDLERSKIKVSGRENAEVVLWL